MDGSHECIPGYRPGQLFFWTFSASRAASIVPRGLHHNSFIINKLEATRRRPPRPEKEVRSAFRRLGGEFAVETNQSGYSRPLTGQDRRPSGSRSTSSPSSPVPDVARGFLATCLWVANNSSRWKTPATKTKRNGIATRAVCQPEFKTVSCTCGPHNSNNLREFFLTQPMKLSAEHWRLLRIQGNHGIAGRGNSTFRVSRPRGCASPCLKRAH
jgi:hypothetical protein